MRQKLFHGENLFFRLMGRLGDFMVLNILYLLTSLPVVTIGAATSALYDVLYDMSRGKEGRCFWRFIRAFKRNFCKTTIYWLLCLLMAVFLISGGLGVRFMGGGRILFRALGIVLVFLWMGVVSFGFILISWADASVREAFLKAVLITAGSFPWLVLNLLITCIPVLFVIIKDRFITAYGIPLFILCGIPLLGYAKTYVYKQALKKYGVIKEEDRNDKGEGVHLSDRIMDSYRKGI